MTERLNVLATVITSPDTVPDLSIGADIPFGVQDDAYLGTVWGIGGAGGYSYSLDDAPAWITGTTVGSVFELTGTVPYNGDGDVTVTVTDALLTTETHTWHIATGGTIRPPGGDTRGTYGYPAVTGQPFSYSIAALLIAATLPVSYVLDSGTLPTGITLDGSTGLLEATTVTEAATGSSPMLATILATDATGQAASIPVRIDVYDPLTYPGNLGITIDATIAFSFDPTPSYSGGVPPLTYGAIIPAGHEWLTFDHATRSLVGTPTDADVSVVPFDVAFYATDALGYQAGGILSITVDPSPQSSIQILKDGFDEGPRGAYRIDFTGSGVSVTSDGTTTTVDIPGGGGGGAVESVAGQLPDSSGNIPLFIPVPILFGAGSKSGSVIPTGTADAGGIVSYEYTLDEWTIETYPAVSAGTFVLDIRRAASGAWPPTGADSICGGSFPQISTGVEASGDVTGFSSDTLNPGDSVDCVVTTNTAGVRWFRIALTATRPV